jgi:uncharacterized protein YecT (DUF1311 family)
MKHLLVLAFLSFFSTGGYAQLEDNELDSLKKVWTKELKSQLMRQEINRPAQDGWSAFADSVFNAYAKDTFMLNGLFVRQLDADPTTFGMVRAMGDYEAGYDKLLNKYYQLLLKKLSKTDREALKESQRNWIRLRDSERNLSGLITKDEYSGGGTIQQLIYADWYAEYTKHRVEELINYLTRLME